MVKNIPKDPYVISQIRKRKRKANKLTQPELAEKSGVGLRFVRDLEQGKEAMRIDKVNQVLNLFGCEVGPIKIEVESLNANS